MQAVEQLSLIEAESDDALFTPSPDLPKRYTAEQARNIEAKRDMILLLFGTGIPVERIAATAKVNRRTVEALVAKDAERVALNRQEFAQTLHRLGASWFGLAKTKEHEAKFSELVVAAGIATQRGNEVGLLGASAEETRDTEAEVISDVGQRVREMLDRTRQETIRKPGDEEGRKEGEGKREEGGKDGEGSAALCRDAATGGNEKGNLCQ
jgi:hypothetical protein